MNFKFRLTTFQKWSIVVKIALNALYRDDVDSVFSCLIPYPMEKSAEITKNERVFSLSAHFLSEFLRTHTHFPFSEKRYVPPGHISLFMRRNFRAVLCGKIHPLLEANPVGSAFNILTMVLKALLVT